ncbi:MAG: hypothetical protein CMM94_02075 [Rickettsiales bacterium]|nr:hypothetical protein [Rickettsiales bacterium]
MMRLIFVILLALFTSHSALAKPIVADLSSHVIEIHSGFSGTELLLFGARNDPGDILVVVRGPERDFIVRRKQQVLGLWVNREQERFESLPYFYAVSSSRPVDMIKGLNNFSSLEINPNDIIHETGSFGPRDHFASALLRQLWSSGLYQQEPNTVEFFGETLFKTTIEFPDDMPRGIYTAEVYLISDGQLVGVQSTPIHVYKTGFDAFVYDSAHNNSVFYGLAAIIIATSFGMGASQLFRRS